MTGITLAENKEIMIANRLDKLKRNTGFHGDIEDLLNVIENEGKFSTEFINTFTTNKTHFF
jgi:chemotaxis protein methyltransferase CheR